MRGIAPASAGTAPINIRQRAAAPRSGFHGTPVSEDCRPKQSFIFLPAAGYFNGSSLNNVGSNGNYWSSTANGSNNAYNLNFNSGNQNVNNNNRNNGYSVRAVLAGE